MTAREQKLAKVFVPVLALVGLYLVYDRAIAGPIAAVSEELSHNRDVVSQLKADIRKQKKSLDSYRTLCNFVPDDRENEDSPLMPRLELTRAHFRDQIDKILESPAIKSKFKVEQVRQPTIKKGKRSKKRKRLDSIAVRVQGIGDFSSVMKILLEVYKLDAPIYVSSLTIDPDDKQHSEKVKAAIEFSTVVIPRDEELIKLLPPLVTQPTADDGGTDGDLPSTGRLVASDMGDYETLADWMPFDPHVPPKPTGACCVGDDECTVVTRSDCSSKGGKYKGDNRKCDSKICYTPPPEGACCLADEECEVLTQQECGDRGGEYKGNKKRCSSRTCKKGPDPKPKPSVAKGPIGDPDRDKILICGFGSVRPGHGEVWAKMEAPKRGRGRKKQADAGEEVLWYQIGDDFDGGKLVKVHRWGAIVSRKSEAAGEDELWVYSYGLLMSEGRPLAEAIETDDYLREIDLDMQRAAAK